jgi:hypothetical protein
MDYELINSNVTVKRSWTFIAKVPATFHFSNNSNSIIEWLLLETGTPTVRFGHRLNPGGQLINIGSGYLFTKVSESNQVMPMSTTGVLTIFRPYDAVSAEQNISDVVMYQNIESALDVETMFSGDYTPFVYSVEGSLPTGLTLDGGTISGTPTTVEDETIQIKAVDTQEDEALTNEFTIRVVTQAVSFSGTIENQTYDVDVEIEPLDVSVYFEGYFKPFTYSVQTGSLPTGLTLDEERGTISGIPTVIGTSEGIVIRATDSESNTADASSFPIEIV